MALWMIASMAVMSVSWAAPIRYAPKAIGYLMVACLAVFILHGLILYNEVSFALASAWMIKVSVILGAALFIAQRTQWTTLFRILLVLAAVQIPILAMEYAGLDTPWRMARIPNGQGGFTEGGTPAGTLPTRAGLSILMGFCSIWTYRWRSCLFGAGALLSTSTSGAIPAGLRLVFQLGKFGRCVVLALSGVACWILLNSTARFSARLEVWGEQWHILRNGWLTGWGFFPLPGSFREDALNGAAWGSIALTDLHSTWLDWLVRFGLVGVLAVAPLALLVARRTAYTPKEWKTWTLVLAVFAGSLQSAEALFVMSLLGIVWLIRLEQEEFDVGSV